MPSRRFQYRSTSIIIVLIVLGILAVINFMSTRHFRRIDLTEGKDFTISDSTKDVLKGLDDIVNIEAYFSEELPQRLAGLKRQIEDIFDEYKAYARGNLEVSFIDPAEDPSLEQKMRFIGIPQAQVNIEEKDKLEVANIYLGVAVRYLDRTEVIPVIQNVMSLEYDLTSAIVKVKRSEDKTIGFLTGHGEYTIDEDYDGIKTVLEKQYSITTVDVSGGKKVPESVDTLVVAGPKQSLSERDKYEIDQFLMRGGRIIFFIDPVDLGTGRGLMATEIESNLNDMLEHYGVKLEQALVLDGASRANASFSSGYVQYTVPYPFWPRITKRQFTRDSPMVNLLESLVLQWASPVELVSSKVETGLEEGAADSGKLRGVELFKSSQYSWTAGKPYNLNPQQRATGDLKPYSLAVAVSGKFESFYAGKPVPEPEKPDEESPGIEPPQEVSAEETISESPETQIIVMGNARFATNGTLARLRRADSHSNRLFFQNAVDWLTLGEELINIRSRSVTDRPLELITGLEKENPQRAERLKLFIKIINICGAPLLVIAFGLTRFFFRRRAKRVFETYSALGS
jgi:gliding-associated putative ABC transporter substrate-binding component GldG